tara:strand:- start:1124 stop:1324 length:201 start_codon:yes stop_codon:yes gene_type:complete
MVNHNQSASLVSATFAGTSGEFFPPFFSIIPEQSVIEAIADGTADNIQDQRWLFLRRQAAGCHVLF